MESAPKIQSTPENLNRFRELFEQIKKPAIIISGILVIAAFMSEANLLDGTPEALANKIELAKEASPDFITELAKETQEYLDQ